MKKSTTSTTFRVICLKISWLSSGRYDGFIATFPPLPPLLSLFVTCRQHITYCVLSKRSNGLGTMFQRPRNNILRPKNHRRGNNCHFSATFSSLFRRFSSLFVTFSLLFVAFFAVFSSFLPYIHHFHHHFHHSQNVECQEIRKKVVEVVIKSQKKFLVILSYCFPKKNYNLLWILRRIETPNVYQFGYNIGR